MLITRQNQKGGPKLKSCPIDIDEKSGNFGYKIGYCDGCNEPLLIRTLDLREILDYFGMAGEFKTQSIREKIIHWLGGEIIEK